MSLLDPVRLSGRDAPNRLLFGPHETNLGRGRAISDRHEAYYLRRARGGAGVIVLEEASVHPSDWPYERAPLATECGPGWRSIADAVHGAGTGTLVLAAIGHAGGQGSSAYSQEPLLAPSRVPEVNSREVPKWMEADDIAAVVEGFDRAAQLAAASGLDGVEVNVGQFSLVRQFLSGLTNQRGDEWGTDRLRFALDVLTATRAGLERGARDAGTVLGLRLSCDELAPWAGITPEAAEAIAAELAPLVDYLVVVRGSIFTTSATRPDFHQPAGFNIELCRSIRASIRTAGSDIPVVLQGSIVSAEQAERALADGVSDLVEMTRAQIADPALGAKLTAGVADQVRCCTLCNQLCMVRDPRNPLVSCAVEPSSGHELDDPSPVPDGPLAPVPDDARTGCPVLVVGGGPAGLEAARVAALRAHPVRLIDRGQRHRDGDAPDDEIRDDAPAESRRSSSEVVGRLGGMAALGSSGTPFNAFVRDLAKECVRLGVTLDLGDVDASAVSEAAARGEAVILATGSAEGSRPYVVDGPARDRVHAAAALFDGHTVFEAIHHSGHEGSPPVVVVLDPIGGPIGVAAAEVLADRAEVHLVTQDNVAGNELARTGDLATANVRLQQAGAHIERRSIVRAIRGTDAAVEVVLEDRFSGVQRVLRAACVIDAGFRLPDEALWESTGGQHLRAGDCVAPRTVHEAVLEGRRAVVDLEGRAR